MADALNRSVVEALGEVDELAGGGTVYVQAGHDQVGGVVVPVPGGAVVPQHGLEPRQLISPCSADLRFAPYQRGFCFGALHFWVRVASAAGHVVGAVVDPLPFLLVIRHEPAPRRPIARGGVWAGGLDRVLVCEVEHVSVHLFVYYSMGVT